MTSPSQRPLLFAGVSSTKPSAALFLSIAPNARLRFRVIAITFQFPLDKLIDIAIRLGRLDYHMVAMNCELICQSKQMFLVPSSTKLSDFLYDWNSSWRQSNVFHVENFAEASPKRHQLWSNDEQLLQELEVAAGHLSKETLALFGQTLVMKKRKLDGASSFSGNKLSSSTQVSSLPVSFRFQGSYVYITSLRPVNIGLTKTDVELLKDVVSCCLDSTPTTNLPEEIDFATCDLFLEATIWGCAP